MVEYGYSLEKLQELRDESTGERRLEYQKMVDNYFLASGPKDGKKKKKKKHKIKNEDDMWW